MEPVMNFYFSHSHSEFLDKFDHYSLKDYLLLKGNLTVGEIELIGEYFVNKCLTCFFHL